MATWTDVPVDEITASGRQARPGRAVVTVLLGLFMVPGWIIGRTWLALADGVVAFRVGYWRGRGLSAEVIAARLKALSEPQQPGPPDRRA